jgi:hypothetical protein
VLTHCLWIGATRTHPSEVLWLFQETQVQSEDEMLLALMVAPTLYVRIQDRSISHLRPLLSPICMSSGFRDQILFTKAFVRGIDPISRPSKAPASPNTDVRSEVGNIVSLTHMSEMVLIALSRTDNALAVASKNLNTDHRPDFTNTEPAANIGPFPQWSDPKKIVAMDPLGKRSRVLLQMI